MEEGLRAFNDALKTVDQCSMKEVDDANTWIDQRGEEIKEIDDVMKNLVGKVVKLEDQMLMLKREGLEQEDMVALLQAKVDSLQSVSAISISTFNFYFFSPRLLHSFTSFSLSLLNNTNQEQSRWNTICRLWHIDY